MWIRGGKAMEWSKYKLKTTFVANVHYKTAKGVFRGKIRDFYLYQDILFASIELTNGRKTRIINLEKRIQNNVVEILNYSGDFIEYIKNGQKKEYIEHQEKDDIEEIMNFLAERGVKYLVHFTRVENVPSILKHGLCSRNYCIENNIPFICSDEERYDKWKRWSSFSIEFPNYQMFYKKRVEYGDKFAVLLIDALVLRLFSLKHRRFFKTNAAANKFAFGVHCNDLEQMFADEELREQQNIPHQYTTDPQAEIMLKGKIPVEYIKQIHLNRADVHYNLFQTIESKDLLCLNRELFDYRIDYKYWQKKEN